MIYIFIFYWIFSVFFTMGFVSKQNLSPIISKNTYNIIYYIYCIIFGGFWLPYLIGKLLSKILVYICLKNEELVNKKNKEIYDKSRIRKSNKG